MNIVRLLHLEWGLPNPLVSDFHLTSVLRGIKRCVGDAPTRKLPITPDILLKLLSKLDLRSTMDSVWWAATLLSFFGLLRRSNVLTDQASFNPDLSLCRRDIIFHDWGIMVIIRKTKTIQNQERCLQIPLPRTVGHRLCPVQAIFHAFHATPSAPIGGPAFVVPVGSKFKPLSPAVFVTKMRCLLTDCGIDGSRYAGHSLRRGGASWAYNSGVAVDNIRVLVDWKSQAYTIYIQPDLGNLRDSIKQMILKT